MSNSRFIIFLIRYGDTIASVRGKCIISVRKITAQHDRHIAAYKLKDLNLVTVTIKIYFSRERSERM